MIVVDTDVLIDFFHGIPGAVELITNPKDTLIFSAITEAELLAGSICSENSEREKVFRVLSQFEKIPVDNPPVITAGNIRRAAGINLIDAIIASTAMHADATLFSRNVKDFEKIEGLKIKKPY